MSRVYQRGSLRRVKRGGGGEVWEWRYRVRGKMRQETYPVRDYPTEQKMWKHLEPSISLLNPDTSETTDEPRGPVKMATVIKRYRKEVLPELARSTRGTDESALKLHIEPRWGEARLGDVRPMAVDAWLKTLTLSAASKGRLKRLLKALLKKSMYWEYLPQQPNPMALVKVKGASKREKKIVLLTPEQVMDLIDALDEPYSIVILISAHLGLRIEETGALQWTDFNFAVKKVTIQRAWTHGEIKKTKTPASEAELPIPDELVEALIAYHETATSKWLFPSSRGDGSKPRWTGIMLQDHIQPVAAKLGLPHIGFHTFRHSYRAWLGGGEATLSEQKDLMRQSSIGMTLQYGGTLLEQMRPLVNAVAAKLRR